MADQVPEFVGHGEALSGSGLVVVDMTFGVQVADLFPTRGDDGWVPASYVPGAQKAPAQVGAGASEGGAAVAAAGSAVRLATANTNHWSTLLAFGRTLASHGSRQGGDLAIDSRTTSPRSDSLGMPSYADCSVKGPSSVLGHTDPITSDHNSANRNDPASGANQTSSATDNPATDPARAHDGSDAPSSSGLPGGSNLPDVLEDAGLPVSPEGSESPVVSPEDVDRRPTGPVNPKYRPLPPATAARIQELLGQGLGITEIARRVGVHRDAVRRIRRKQLYPTGRKRRFTDEDRQRAQALRRQGKTFTQIGLELGFTRCTISKHLAEHSS